MVALPQLIAARVPKGKVAVPQISFHPLPIKKFKQLVAVLKITKPIAGDVIASRCMVVIRGGKNPCVELEISSFAEAFGLVVPMPTPLPLL